jgi:DNA-binding response OmpR family regulator
MESRRILAIEGNWRIRKLIRANLEAIGLVVDEAVSEQHGLQHLGAERPDLILLDLELVEGDALALLRTLHRHAENQPVPIVVMSTEPLSRSLMACEHIAGHLQKPFAVPALLEQVRSALDNSHPVD